MKADKGKPVSVTQAVYEALSELKRKTGLSRRQIASLAIRHWTKSKEAKALIEKIT
jgi:predicted nucleic acid-binding protein